MEEVTRGAESQISRAQQKQFYLECGENNSCREPWGRDKAGEQQEADSK